MDSLSQQDDVARIRQGEQGRLDAMCSRDAAALEALLAPDFTYTHSNGSTDGKAEIIARVGGDGVRYRGGRFLSLAVRLYGDTAVVNGHFNLTVEVADKTVHLNGRSLSVWRRADVRGGIGWQQVATASTPIIAAGANP